MARIKISFRLPMPVNSTGANKILIQLDPDNKINELPLPFAESNNELNINNQAGIVVNIYSNDVRPIEPPDFGIVGNADIQLKAFGSDAFKSGKFLFQIDTTALFNSPFLKSIITIQRSGMITWKPGFPPEPNRVYYWRVAGDTTGKKSTVVLVHYQSFIYLPGQGPVGISLMPNLFKSGCPGDEIQYRSSQMGNVWKIQLRSFLASIKLWIRLNIQKYYQWSPVHPQQWKL